MKLKLDDKGNVVVTDGKPVYVHDDGREIAFDAPGTIATISRLNGEAKGHREAKEAAEAKLTAFEGIDDPAKAKAALETVSNLDAKKLVDAGEVDKVKAEAVKEAVKATEAKFRPIEKERDTLRESLTREKIGGAFTRSKFIADKMTLPADIVEATFGRHFKLEGDTIVPYDATGNKIFSPARPGEVASFDEALEVVVQGYSNRDSILKGTGASGGGAQGGGRSGGPKTMTRAAFGALPLGDQAAAAKEFTITD